MMSLCKRRMSERFYSQNGKYEGLIHRSVENVNQLLEKSDRSSYILAQYVPEPARNTFLAIRAFNLEVNKIHDGGKNVNSRAFQASNQMAQTLQVSTADLKFKFWSDLVLRVFTGDANTSSQELGEPIAMLLRDGLRNGLNLDISYFQQFLQTRRHFIKNNAIFNTTNDICSYGEGTYSQLNYLTQGLLLSPSISPSSIKLLELSNDLQTLVTDISAHIGQATAIASMINGLRFYASSRNQVTLPVDLMTKNNLSQESVLRLFQGHITDTSDDEFEIRDCLKQVVYETSIVANDHMLTARKKLADFKVQVRDVINSHRKDELLSKYSKNWRGNVPDTIFTPMMIGIPTSLYLRKLEKYDFDILNPRLQQREWRLAWTSFRDYYKRTI
ncbi:hypothetical protein KGF56_004617 [Candida oxycetoniae]|uniref:NADH dehydrogenase (Ubiquinone) complex I, assembly factor 6 n=1 Tax=Candida oxycetoniae TaxID=497107 RepID=A0AAI9SSX6_9ASCO|nr:uncharacterized protein KGF56_004617 [Candida oxycetoniae]KAI3402525.2 hypothetical protein KGF56_004617 [Candida oxycetoniae]